MLNETDKSKKLKKKRETDGYGRNKRPEIEKKLKKNEITITETRKKLKRTKKNRKAVWVSTKSVRRLDVKRTLRNKR